jgi:hypothetical protein
MGTSIAIKMQRARAYATKVSLKQGVFSLRHSATNKPIALAASAVELWPSEWLSSAPVPLVWPPPDTSAPPDHHLSAKFLSRAMTWAAHGGFQSTSAATPPPADRSTPACTQISGSKQIIFVYVGGKYITIFIL